MVLMQVLTVVRQNDVRKVFSFELLEEILYFGSYVRKIAVPKFLDDDLFSSCIRQKQIGTLNSLGPSLTGGPQDDPAHVRSGVFFKQSENCAATADLDVVGVGPERQDLLRPNSVLEDGDPVHAAAFNAPRPLWAARRAASTPPTGPGRVSTDLREAACP